MVYKVDITLACLIRVSVLYYCSTLDGLHISLLDKATPAEVMNYSMLLLFFLPSSLSFLTLLARMGVF